MFRKLVMILTLGFLIPGFVLAQSGKMRGKITDKESGEALVGANVVIEGTTMGAVADVNGDYVILDVPGGVYTLKGSYVGYTSVSISNIRVNAGITTTQDFKLPSSTVQVQAIEIVAERPLIQRNTTNTVRIQTQEDIENLPIRGVQNVVALNAGVVQQAGNLYVRGGRSDEVAYYVDGAPVTNPLINQNNISLIQEAVEEVQLQAGGYTAEYGGANSGIVRTNMRTGGSQYNGSLTYETDDFAKPGNQFLGTSAQGYRNVVATIGGPIPGVDKLFFFAAYQNNYLRDRTFTWVTPFSFNLTGDGFNPGGEGQALPGPVAFKQNYIPGEWQDAHTVQGTMRYDFQPLKFLFTGSYQVTKSPFLILNPENSSEFADAVYNMFRVKRSPITTTYNSMFGLRVTHVIDPSTYYEVGASYQARARKRLDPDFGNNWTQYTDSVANAALGYTGFINHWQGAPAYTVIDGFPIANENAPNGSFVKQKQESWGGSLDFTRQMTRNWELKVGGRYDQWTMRFFGVGSITGRQTRLFGSSGNLVNTFPTYDDYRIAMARAGSINYYGYDVDGNPVNSGPDAPYKPRFISAYLQNKLEYKDVIINVGLRFEYFKPNSKTFPNPTDPLSAFDVSNDVIDQTKLVDAPSYSFVLPRISFSFPVTDNTVFYSQYGKYAQMPSLNQLYVGNVTLSRTVSPSSRGNAYLTPVGFLMIPERSTQYEIGIRQMVTDNLAFTLSGFYKDTENQLQVRNEVSSTGVALYRAYLNDDFGTIKGVELTLELKRTERFAARVNYTLSDARGTGDNPNSAFGIIEQGIGRQINMINPLGYNQTHRGSVLLDYRWPMGEGGPVLSGLGGNLLITFNSGHPYTAIQPLSSLGQSDPWTVGVYPSADPRFSFPIEPINSSTTPFFLNIDMRVGKLFALGPVNAEIYVAITNLLNTKQVINVYPTTGTAEDDGWLTNPLAAGNLTIPNYEAFYRAMNLENRFAYTGLTNATNVGSVGQIIGGDIYGLPRQIRLGLKVDL